MLEIRGVLKIKRHFRNLRDWRIWYIKHGKTSLLKNESCNPYISRILKAANRYGWDYPFDLVVGHGSKHDRFEQHHKLLTNIEAEERLISILFYDEDRKGGEKNDHSYRKAASDYESQNR